jgi:ribosome-binding factor A
MTSNHRRSRERTASPSHHQQHEQLLLEEVRTLFRIDLVDPRFTPVVIVAAHLSADGSVARIAWATHAEDPTLEVALEKASGYLRARLAESLNWKRTPTLRFVALGVLPKEPS